MAPVAGGARPRRESGIRFAPGTVVISRSTVGSELEGISKAGVFEFKSAGGGLSALKVGHVMFLQGADALVVTHLAHEGSKLFVSTKPATLTQLIADGHISASGTPNFSDAVVAPLLQPASSGSAADTDFATPGYPYVGRPVLGLHEATIAGSGPDLGAALSKTLTFQGTVPIPSKGLGLGVGYSITFSPGGGSTLKVDGTLCFGAGGICSNGPANGADLQISFSGTVDLGKLVADINVNNSKATASNFNLTNPEADFKFKYTAADSAKEDIEPPTFYFPVGTDLTLPGTIPIYAKLQCGAYIKAVFSSKNSTVNGGLVPRENGGQDSID